MAETPTMAEMVAALQKEIVLAKAISGSAGYEPAYRYLCDPPGRSVIDAYLQQEQSGPLSDRQRLPVFFVELPPLFQDDLSLVEVLSRGLGLRMTGKWKDWYLVEERLAEQLRSRQVELVILADAHHLKGKRKCSRSVACFAGLVSLGARSLVVE